MMLLLNEGNDIFSSKVAIDEGKNTLKEKALSFSKCFLERKWAKLHQHFQPAVCKVFTIDLLKNFRETVEEQFGNFKSILHIDQFENDVSLYIEFEKCTAVMKVIFSAFHITGFTVNSIDTDMINNFLTDANNIDQSESGSNFIIRI